MFKTIFIVLGLIITFPTFSQTTIQGTILDSLSKAPLPFVHIIANNGTATISDENGHFSIDKNNEKISFSLIGYNRKDVELSGNKDTVFMNPGIYLLPEIKVTPQKMMLLEIGNTEKLKLNSVNTSITSLSSSFQIVKFIDNEKKVEGQIKTISFYVAKRSKFNQKIRLVLLSSDSTGQKPNKEILSKSVIMEIGNKKKWNIIDISDLYIFIPSDGLFVGLEFLPIKENIQREDKLAIGLINKEDKCITYTKRINQSWVSSNYLKDIDGEIANLLVKLEIESSVNSILKK